MTDNPSVKKNIVLSTAYQILILIVPFITAPYVSRILGAEGVGVYSFTNSIATYFTMFAALGTMSYGAREISRARNNRRLLSRLFWEIESLVVITSLVCMTLWLLWVFFAPNYNIIYLILSMTLLGTIADISWFFYGLEQFKYIVLRNSFVKIIGVILLFIFIKEKTDLTLYIFLMTITNFIGALSMWMYIPKMIDKIDWKSINIKPHFKETLVYFIPSVATSIYTILNKVLLGIMGGDICENGYFEQATRITAIAQALTYASINNVLRSRIAFLFVENKIDEIHQRIEKSLQYILFTGIGITLGIIAIAPRFVPWFFGLEFNGAIILLQLLSPIVLIIGISNCLGSQYYTPSGLRKQSARYIVIGSIVNLCLNIALIPNYGAKGAVVGSLMAELTITILYFLNCKNYMTIEQIVRNGWKKCLAGVVMFIFIHYIQYLFDNNTLAVLIPSIGGLLVYLTMLLLFRDQFTLQLVKIGLYKS